MNLAFLVGGILLLIFGGDRLVNGAVALALRLNISRWIVGLTVVSFATSAPELVVSLFAAIDGHPDISLGNVIGSNIANIALVLAMVITLFGIHLEWKKVKIDVFAVLLTSIALTLVLFLDNGISRTAGVLLFTGLIAYIFYLIRGERKEGKAESVGEGHEQDPLWKSLLALGLGGIALYFGSEGLIQGAVGLSRNLGISERVISLTMVSVGTSIPELVASIIAASKKEGSLSVGNLIGSNIFNVLSVLGLTAIIHPIQVQDQGILGFDLWVMLGAVAGLFLLSLFGKSFWSNRLIAALILMGYAVYIVSLFTGS